MTTYLPVDAPYGYCKCGCGSQTKLERNGIPRDYHVGHARRRRNVPLCGYIVTESGCWQWSLNIKENGYGTYSAGKYAHRREWERANGPIPPGMQIDHLCRNRACVNPDHLEAVTQRENIMRGVSPVAINAAKTHCKRGHPLDEANTFVSADTGYRQCIACRSVHSESRRIRNSQREDAA